MAPQADGSQMDSMLLSQRGVKALDRGPRSPEPRVSPFWAAVGAIVLLAIALGAVLWFLK